MLERTATTITVMNLYPYGSGHLMVAPVRHEASLDGLRDDEAASLMALAQVARRARDPRRVPPDGVNVGVNLGGPRAPACPATSTCTSLPRWTGDTNFMTAVAEVRVLPEDLRTGYEKLRAAWPEVASAPGSPTTGDRLERASARRTVLTMREPTATRATRCPKISTSPRTSGRTCSPTSPAPHRRRRCYVVLGVLSLLGSRHRVDNRGLLVRPRSCSRSIAVYHFVARWPLSIDQTEALAVASRTVGFPVGHASAQLAWRGLLSRPAWRILVYSADEPPSMRGLVRARRGRRHVLGEYTEPNPEDWSKFGLDETAGQAP